MKNTVAILGLFVLPSAALARQPLDQATVVAALGKDGRITFDGKYPAVLLIPGFSGVAQAGKPNWFSPPSIAPP